LIDVSLLHTWGLSQNRSAGGVPPAVGGVGPAGWVDGEGFPSGCA
jgi:hypothetical protein